MVLIYDITTIVFLFYLFYVYMDKLLLKYIEGIENKYKCDFLILESRIEILEQYFNDKVVSTENIETDIYEEPKKNLFSKIIKKMKKMK
jgi:hypothetical protein